MTAIEPKLQAHVNHQIFSSDVTIFLVGPKIQKLQLSGEDYLKLPRQCQKPGIEEKHGRSGEFLIPKADIAHTPLGQLAKQFYKDQNSEETIFDWHAEQGTSSDKAEYEDKPNNFLEI